MTSLVTVNINKKGTDWMSTYYKRIRHLNDLASQLFASGLTLESVQILEVALAAIQNPAVYASEAMAQEQVTQARQLLEKSRSIDSQKKHEELLEIDLYQEDECDVGPRTLPTNILLESLEVADVNVIEIAIVYNKGLVCHLTNKLTQAKEYYQSVLVALRKVVVDPLIVRPSLVILELGMRCENNLGVIYYSEGDEELAMASFESSLNFARHLSTLSKQYRLEYIDVLSNCCRVAWMQGDISDHMVSNLREILQVRILELEPDHPDVAASHFNIAMIEYARQHNDEAMPHILDYLRICSARSQVGKNDMDIIPGLIYLMLIKNHLRSDSISQELLRGLHTLQDKRQDQGTSSSEVASVLNYVGTLLFHQEDFENALLIFQEELRIESSMAHEPDDVSSSVTCNNIGRILQELGRFNDAITFYQRALVPEYGDVTQLRVTKGSSVCRRWSNLTVTANSSAANLYSTVWYNLGLIHDKLGSYDDAIFAFEMSLELRRSLLGVDHPDIACLLYNIGVLRMERQQLDEATDCFREALRVRRLGNAGQLNDRHVVKTLEKLSSLHRATGNINGALELLQEVLVIHEASADFDMQTKMKETGITLRAIAELYHAVGELPTAMQTVMMSVMKLRGVVAEQLATVDPYEYESNIEQLASSLLLQGSLSHEACEPMAAQTILQDAAVLLSRSSFTSPSLIGLRDVTLMLATAQSAPCA